MLKQPLEFFGVWYFFFLALLVLTVIFPACQAKPQISPSSPPEPIYFSKNWKAGLDLPADDAGVQCWVVRTETGDLAAFLSTHEGMLQCLSGDEGRTWSPPRLIFVHAGPAYPLFHSGRLVGMLTFREIAHGGQIYFHARQESGWSEPSAIRDTDWGTFTYRAFAADTAGNFYCAWRDFRAGNFDIYFSSSHDGGKTWNANVRLDDDQAGQEQNECALIAAPQGVLYAFWTDNRDPRTLFDVYSSFSHDGGKTWHPGIKVNDDTTHSFQVSPQAVIDDKGIVYAAWRDYRDQGASGDLNANIYFSRSEDGGKSWRPNVRVSHARFGHNWFPALHLDAEARLHCLWMSSEDNPAFDIFHSYSSDGGQTWSPPLRVNDDLARVPHDYRPVAWLGADAKENIVLGWLDWREERMAVYMARTLEQPDATHPERQPQPISSALEKKANLPFQRGAALFQDDYAENSSPHWQPQSGTWVCKDQTYIGYGAAEAQSFAGSESWADYVFAGRFKLDPLEHKAALIYLRVTRGRGGWRYFRLNNFFRGGVRLEYFNGKSLSPLADAPYSFQKDRWYAFRTVIKGDILNHFIDDSLLIARDKLDHNSRGRIGLGALGAPAYFKDIRVTEIK